jgi:hypothetical protein
MKAVKRYPDAEIRRILDIVQSEKNVSGFDDPAFFALSNFLSSIAGESRPTISETRGALSELRAVLMALAEGRKTSIAFTGALVYARTKEGRIHRRLEGGYATRVVDRVIDLILQAGASRLQACPFRSDPNERKTACGRLFLAERRQRFCSVEHSKADARRAYRKRERERRDRERRAVLGKKRTSR